MERDCPFCEIIRGERPAQFIYRDESLVVFRDIHPAAPVHLLVVPTKHIRSVNDISEPDQTLLTRMILKARDVAREHGMAEKGYKLLFNVERGGGQVIFHLHMHLMGGW